MHRQKEDIQERIHKVFLPQQKKTRCGKRERKSFSKLQSFSVIKQAENVGFHPKVPLQKFLTIKDYRCSQNLVILLSNYSLFPFTYYYHG